ncbi:sulfatase family protein [Paenibacillus mendelii]|uniref:Sulfatase n=1 Tax=Paenibacillus mendelii TaxID=206163 RepID=A0ABV6JAF7_9BACL|nr:sulfatase-like hydrolase/transferase [Paenibacillus mendelii]
MKSSAVIRSKRPNVLIIHTDQQRYDSLGCTGNLHAITPHIDKLAAEGTLFHRHVTAHPVCMPSRASFFTGRYPNASGVYANGVALPRKTHVTAHPMNAGAQVQAEAISHVPTMPDAFSEAGYRTAAIGKLHFTCTNGPRSSRFEESRIRWSEEDMSAWSGPYYGFDQVELTIGHGEDYTGHYGSWLRKTYPEVAEKVRSGSFRGSGPAKWTLYPSVVPVEAHSSTWIADRAIAYLNSAADQVEPFFLFLGFPDPHFPFTPPAELAERFQDRGTMAYQERAAGTGGVPSPVRKLYEGDKLQNAVRYGDGFVHKARQFTDAMIHLIDISVGRIRETLQHLGLDENTIIVYTSDHGDYLGDYGLVFKANYGSKTLNHVPFMMKVPKKLAELPKECHAAMSNTDVMPTLCQLAGVPVPDGVQGRSVVPLLLGEAESWPVQVTCYDDDPSGHNFSLWNDRYRYTWYPATGERELYDHVSDPYETDNIAGMPSIADVERNLHAALLEQHCLTDRPSLGKSAQW